MPFSSPRSCSSVSKSSGACSCNLEFPAETIVIDSN